MNTNLTEIAFILDRSGSMSGLAHGAIAGFNHFLLDQQSAPGQARITVILFDDEYLVHVDAVPVAEVLPLNTDTYVPRNSTALLDSIGRTIDNVGARLAKTPEPHRPGKVIVAILTDGLENASTQYTWRDIAERIKHQTERYQWEFLFLGANQDAIATAAQLNIATNNAATYAADNVGQVAGSASLARKSRALRARAAGIATAFENEVAEASMQQLLREDDEMRRGR